MPTESSVISDLIRGVNTRRLDDEPADDWLFQPAPRQRPPDPRTFEDAATAVRPLARSSDPVIARSPVLARRMAVAKPVARPLVAEPVARPVAPSHLETWQQILMMLFVGVLAAIPFMYFELDGEDLVAELSIDAPQPAAAIVTMPVVAPAAPIVEQPAVAPAALEQPAVPTTTATLPTPTATLPAPTVTIPKHHHHHATNRVAAPHDQDPQPAAEVVAPEPQPAVTEPALPKRPAAQRDDSENPLKRK